MGPIPSEETMWMIYGIYVGFWIVIGLLVIILLIAAIRRLLR